MKKQTICICIAALSLFSASVALGQNWTETKSRNWTKVTNKGGQTLGYVTISGVKILTDKGFAFKDLNKNGKLDKYETGGCRPMCGLKTWRRK